MVHILQGIVISSAFPQDLKRGLYPGYTKACFGHDKGILFKSSAL